MRSTHFGVRVLAATIFSLSGLAVAKASSSFALFESGHVRPLAISPNGRLLFAVNTPDNRLEVFRILQ